LPDDLGYCADIEDADFTVNQEQLTKRIKYNNLVLNHFWRRWCQEYLAELRESHRGYSQRCSGVPTISVGDVVIVHEESLPRGFWKLGLVKELFKGRDGVTRGAIVKLASKSRRPSFLHRPIQHLYPLEIHQEIDKELLTTDKKDTADSPEAPDDIDSNPESEEDHWGQCVARPKRAAAQKLEERRRLWIKELTEEV